MGRETRSIVGKERLKKPKNLKKPVKINREAKIEKILPEEIKPYTCTCCGKEYKRQRDFFSTSRSPLFAGNNGYIPVCKVCADKYFLQLVDVFSGDEIPALERICAIFDWYFDDVSLAAARKSTTDRSMLNSYLSKLNLIQTLKRGTTYLDYVKQQIDHPIETKEDLEEYRKNDNKVSDRDIKRWGLGFKPDEYAFLKDHYNMLKDLAGPDDIVTDNLIRDLCVIKVQTNRALADGETDKYAKMTELYQKTLTTANLKPKGSKDAAAVTQIEGIDMAIRDIEKYTPAEFFKDKALYKDHDGIGEYFMRFIVRPFKNLFTGSKEMDSEYSVTASQDGE